MRFVSINAISVLFLVVPSHSESFVWVDPLVKCQTFGNAKACAYVPWRICIICGPDDGGASDTPAPTTLQASARQDSAAMSSMHLSLMHWKVERPAAYRRSATYEFRSTSSENAGSSWTGKPVSHARTVVKISTQQIVPTSRMDARPSASPLWSMTCVMCQWICSFR
jgi:hypothetical protein